jgi:iron complex outermembrane recepter protein
LDFEPDLFLIWSKFNLCFKSSIMKTQLSALFLMLLCFSSLTLPAQTEVTVTGKITDVATGEPLIGVNVYLKDRLYGTVTNVSGEYGLTFNLPASGTSTLIYSYIGYKQEEKEVTGSATIDIALQMSRIQAHEVVISASRVPETIRESPVTIEKMDLVDIRHNPSLTYYEGLANLKSVDMTTPSFGFKVINARGFNSTTNVKFVQRIDGMDNQAPGLNFSVGNMTGISDLDVESVELLPGASSALYGPNAFNGLLNIISKSPFKYPGLSVSVKGGVNHIDGNDTDMSPLYEALVRYARPFNNDRTAFKINFGYLRAEDWHANSIEDIDVLTPAEFRGENNPSRDALNIYGDEMVRSLRIGPGGAPVRVSRTGYFEKDLVDYGTKILRFDGAIHQRIMKSLEVSYQYKFANGTAVYQGANRYSLSDFVFQQHKLELSGANFYIRGYGTFEDSGDSYDSRFLALNLNRAWKSDAQWFDDYTNAFMGNIPDVFAGDHEAARAFADIGRLLPGSPEFDLIKEEVAGIDDFKTGAKFNDKSNLYVAETQYNFTSIVKIMEVLAGGNYRLFDLNSNGTIFPDTAGNDITIYEYGAYLQAGTKLLNDKLKLLGSVRYDKSENFDGQFTPRIATVVNPVSDHYFRASYQTGFRMPTTQEQFIFLDVGNIILVGGVPGVGANTLAYENSYTLESVQLFGAAVNAAIAGGMDPSQAVIENRSLLTRANVDFIKPEKVSSFEIGYRGIIAAKLYYDINYYYNKYKDFIVLQRVIRPNTDIDGPDANAAPFDIVLDNFQPFQLYTNLNQEVASNGIELGLNYYLPRNYEAGITYAYTRFLDEQNQDVINGFNTPEHKVNFSIGNKTLTNRLGFKLGVRWIDEFLWEGSFANGPIPSYTTLDAQLSYKVPQMKTMLKIGGTNLLNNRHIEIYGGPNVGGVYYVSLTYDELFNF